MRKRWHEPHAIALRDGRWSAECRIIEEVPNGVEERSLSSPAGLTFATENEAVSYAQAMGVKYLTDT